MRYGLMLLASALLTAVILGVVLELYPMSFFDESYAMYQQVKEASLRPSQQKSRLLILGDSRPKAAIIPQELGANVESLTLTGGTPLEIFYTLERYLARHPAPERILLSISAVHFNDGSMFWEHTVKYRYLDSSTLETVLAESRSLGDDIFGSEWESRWQLFAYQYKLLHLYFPELRAAFIQLNRSARNLTLFSNLERARGHAWFGARQRSSDPAYEVAHKVFHVSPTLDRYFRRLLHRSRTSGAKVVFAAMPLNRASRGALSSAFVNGYQAYFERIARDYPQISFSSGWPVLPDEDFGDANHVNARGAKKMTAWVRGKLGL